MMKRDMKVLLHLLIAFAFFQAIKCAAIASLEFLNYTNPRGITTEGKTCDRRFPGEEVACDHFFQICVSPRPRSQSSCMWSKIWHNQNTITFPPGSFLDQRKRRKNPLLFHFNQWKESIIFKIYARDEDGLFDDLNDIFRHTETFRPDKNGKIRRDRILTLTGTYKIATISIRMRLLCVDGPKPPFCSKTCKPILSSAGRWDCQGPKCVPRDDDKGHYSCDMITGQIKCLPGWKDVKRKCLSDVRSDVSCTENYMRIDIDRKYFDPSKYSAITLLDQTCKATISETQIVLDSAPFKCGSKKEETKDSFIYRNEVYMKAIPTDALITREHDVRVSFSCTYNKTGLVSLEAYKPLSTATIEYGAAGLLWIEEGAKISEYGRKAYGTFQFNFKMYKDLSYQKQIVNYPVKMKLNDSMYFEANTTANDDDLVLLIDRCYSTPTMDHNHLMKYTFVDNGCATDRTVKFVKAGAKKQRFTLHAFSFIKKSRQVYIHCVLFMCRKSSKEVQCTRGCDGNNVNRVRRDAGEATASGNHARTFSKYFLLDIGPIRRDFDPVDKAKEPVKGTSKSGPSFMTIGLIIGVAVLTVIATAMFIVMRRRPKSSDDTHKVPVYDETKEFIETTEAKILGDDDN